MSDATTATVDLLFSDQWDALAYHRFFWERCRGTIVLQSLNVEHGILEFPGNTIFEYDEDRVENESYYAYFMLRTWYGLFPVKRMVRFHFSRKPEAAMFKLTFGGS